MPPKRTAGTLDGWIDGAGGDAGGGSTKQARLSADAPWKEHKATLLYKTFGNVPHSARVAAFDFVCRDARVRRRRRCTG